MTDPLALRDAALDRIETARFDLRVITELLTHLGEVAVERTGTNTVPGDWVEFLARQAGALVDEIGAAMRDADPQQEAS